METALLATNLVIAIVYAWILVVMVQQRKVMSQQLAEMQSTRLAAHRPVLVVREELVGDLQRPCLVNIGNGPAVNISARMQFKGVTYEVVVEPLGVREKATLSVFVLPVPLSETVWHMTYRDIFGSVYETVYEVRERRHTFLTGGDR
jgi:hypothetical protein